MSPMADRGEISIDEGWRIHVHTLLSERDDMLEEIRQLRASLQIYAEIVRRLESEARAA